MKVTLTLATTPAPLADNVAFGFYRFSILGQPDVDTANTVVEYDLPPGGAYHVVAQAYAADGSPLGVAMADFTVPSDTVSPPPRTYPAPSSISVAFG
jgi:hypothetical protein